MAIESLAFARKWSYVVVVGDYFTRWMEAIPIPNKEASTLANYLEIFSSRVDQGPQFES